MSLISSFPKIDYNSVSEEENVFYKMIEAIEEKNNYDVEKIKKNFFEFYFREALFELKELEEEDNIWLE